MKFVCIMVGSYWSERNVYYHILRQQNISKKSQNRLNRFVVNFDHQCVNVLQEFYRYLVAAPADLFRQKL